MEEELLKKIKAIEKKVNANATELKNHIEEISGNKKQIQQNTSALEILRTFKADSNKFFIMWLVTFITLLFSIGVIVFLLHG